MKFRIPFTWSLDRARKKAIPFKKLIKHKKNSKLQDYLRASDTGLTREEYLAICLRTLVFTFIISCVLLTTFLGLLKVNKFLLYGIVVGVLFSCFVFYSQLLYPKLYAGRKQREIERNLIPALEDMLVQLNSGIPLFSIMVNISIADYGELSNEFRKAVKKINAGLPQIEVLEELGEKNQSIFFRRTLWQLSNGMKAGSDISQVIRESIKALNEEQLIQIQNYGNKLNPMIMFYMLISVIMPALAITFLTVISSLVNLAETITTLLYVTLFVGVTIIQVMFLGIIRSIRPSLL